jgi:hypothetical protein
MAARKLVGLSGIYVYTRPSHIESKESPQQEPAILSDPTGF